MPVLQSVSIHSFLDALGKAKGLLIDARSEGEFGSGHIPGAINIPILHDQERAEVGTIYKHQGHDAAVQKGFELAGPRFAEKIALLNSIQSGKPPIHLYCWRGGMRSRILGWLFETAGYPVTLLQGGYKSWRNRIAEVWENCPPLLILGGATGSGKTEFLNRLAKVSGEAVIDLEELALHKGSAFGNMGKPEQPRQEHFENELAIQIIRFQEAPCIWLENESRRIGNLNIPDPIFSKMRLAPMIEVQVDKTVRMQRILAEYGHFEKALLEENTLRLTKRLGGQHAKAAIEALHEGRMNDWVETLLVYYDKTYDYGNSLRNKQLIFSLSCDWSNPDQTVNEIIETRKKISSLKIAG